jgi:CBS domain-containing protein
MKTLAQILAELNRPVLGIDPGESVHQALVVMAQHEVGALLVMEGAKLVGIFSERDYARKIILQGKSSRETKVREIMTERVTYLTPEKTVEEAMAVMAGKHIRHLPVLDANEQVKGIVSIRDLVRETIAHQAFIIQQLENYINNG